MANKKICFFLSPIGDDDSPERKHSDNVLNNIINPVLQEFGYEPFRADHIPKPGIITTQIIDHILNAPLVIADLTRRNPNVFYELAIRQVYGKPFIQIMQKGESIPFDVGALRTIFYDLYNIEDAQGKIRRQIDHIENNPGEMCESPISVALDSLGRSLAPPVAQPNVDIEIGYLTLKVEQKFHEYVLIFGVKNNMDEAIKEIVLELKFPTKYISPSGREAIKRYIITQEKDYSTFVFDSPTALKYHSMGFIPRGAELLRNAFLPGNTAYISHSNKENWLVFKYAVNDKSYDEIKKYDVSWKLFINGKKPIEGSRNFQELQCF